MTVEIMIKCNNCGESYNSVVFDFCPHCSGNINLDVPTEQIQQKDSQSKPKPMSNHSLGKDCDRKGFKSYPWR